MFVGRNVLDYRTYNQRQLQSDIFKMGYKPSIWLQYPTDKTQIEELKYLKYSHKIFLSFIENGITGQKRHIVNYWFFQNKEMKNKFKSLRIHEKIFKKEINHYNIGELLGFPPKAIDLFQNEEYKKDFSNKIGVNYCGISFMSYNDSLIDDLIWLNDNVKVPLDEKLFVEVDSF